MNTEDFRKHAHQIVDWIADYYQTIEKFPVKSQVKPGEIKGQLPLSAPENGESFDQIISDFNHIIMPGISHWQHPSWFAYFPANSSPASVLGEMLTAGLGVQSMIWDTSPAATELEDVIMAWLREMCALPEDFTGVIQDTASTATLCALLSAREKATDFQANKSGLNKKLRIYASAHTHSSIEKGVKIAGIGKENLICIATDENFSIIPHELEKAIKDDIAHGYTPCCMVGTIGTTSSMAIDPIYELGEICKKHSVWLHVDAAFAGTAAIVPEYRHLFRGVELADSYVFNPHKWMLTNFDCTAYFVRDTSILKHTFSILPEYLKTNADNQVNNYRDWGIQLGRRFRALKLWFVIRHYGVEGIRQMITKHVKLADRFAGCIRMDENFELLAPVQLSLVCFRYRRQGASNETLNELNRTLLERVNATGKIYLTHTILNDKYGLRMSVGQARTDERHVRQAWEIIRNHTLEL